MSKALTARLKRLERRKVRRKFPRLVLHVYGRDSETELLGYGTSEGVAVMRSPSESLGALRARAWALTNGMTLSALYVPSTARYDAAAEPSARSL